MITDYDRVVNENTKLREQVRRYKAAAKRVRECERTKWTGYSKVEWMNRKTVLAALRLRK